MTDTATPILFADRGCPFAHRVLAALEHLAVTATLRESEVGTKPPGLARYSTSERIPLLVHGELVIVESRVMIEYLAERYGWAEALPAELTARTLHRQAMALVDDFIVPRLTRTRPEDEPSRLDDVLNALEQATQHTAPEPCLLTLHLAPIWLRHRWWNPKGSVVRSVEQRPALCRWLDAAVELECIARTAPDRSSHLQDLARAREAGLIPWEPAAASPPQKHLQSAPQPLRHHEPARSKP